MGAENTPVRWLRSRPTSGGYAADKIDTEQGILYDVVMVQEGPAKGHGVHLEAEFISDLVAYDKRVFGDRGVKARFGHPGASSETMGTQMGVFKNIRKRKGPEGKMQAIGDLHLLEAADESPTHPGMRSWMLKMATEQPDFVMSSIVFQAGGYYQRKANGHKKSVASEWDVDSELGDVFVEFGEKGQHYYTDMVEAGAATDALFSNQANPHLFVAQAGEFLEEHPALKAFIQNNPDKVREFLAAQGINFQPIMSETKKPTLLQRLLASFTETEEEQFVEELTTQQFEREVLENRVTELEADVATLQTTLSEKETELTQVQSGLAETTRLNEALSARVTTLLSEIAELKKQPADVHTGGQVDLGGKESTGSPKWQAFKERHGIV